MTDDKFNSGKSAASAPPAIAPRTAIPRPPGPVAAGERIPTVDEPFNQDTVADADGERDLNTAAQSATPAPTPADPDADAQSDVEAHTDAHVEVDNVADNADIDAPEAADGAPKARPSGVPAPPPELSGNEGVDASEDEEGPIAAAGAKMKGWAESALESVKALGGPKEQDHDEEHPARSATATPAGTFGSTAPGAGTPGASGAPIAAMLAGGTTAPREAGSARVEKPRSQAAVGAPRKVKLAIARLDPWSVMKLSFLMSVALGIMVVVAAWVFWYALNDLGVFTSIDELISGIVGQESADLDILQYLSRDKVMSVATLIAVVDVVLLTALATIGAFLYNIVAALVGGIHMTMSDD